MKILLLERDWRPCAGGEVMVMEIAKGLSAKGHSIFLAYEFDGYLLQQNRAIFKAMTRVSLQPFGWRMLASSLGAMFALWRLARKWEVDVIFTSNRGFLRTLALLRVISGLPFAYHLGLGPPTHGLSNKFGVKLLDAGISPSHFNGNKWLKAGLPARKLHVVPNWIDTLRFSPGGEKLGWREKLGLVGGGSLVVYVGRVVSEKGVETLLEAFSRITTNGTDATLVVVGETSDEYKKKISELIAGMNLRENRILLFGNSTSPEVYFAAADVVVVPSIVEESFGLTAVEAMACGALTLVSDSGELANLPGAENRDLIFPRGDAAALTAKLEHWLAQPEAARQRGLKLRERVLEHFQGSAKLKRYETILASLIKH